MEAMKPMNITVFGGSQSKPGDRSYLNALELGRQLGSLGYTVLTGGYIGTMEAVSRGAFETGGNVIGVTCEEIESWRPIKPNSWIHEERRHPSLRLRLFDLIENCDAALVLPGGPGTLLEISALWNHMIIQALPCKPLILIGDEWHEIFDQAYTSLGEYIPEIQRQFLQFTPDVTSAVQLLIRLKQ